MMGGAMRPRVSTVRVTSNFTGVLRTIVLLRCAWADLDLAISALDRSAPRIPVQKNSDLT